MICWVKSGSVHANCAAEVVAAAAVVVADVIAVVVVVAVVAVAYVAHVSGYELAPGLKALCECIRT